jgi:hypothetical protein
MHPAIDGAAIGVAAVGGTMSCIMLVERAVEFVVAVGVIVQDDAAGGRVDCDLFDARNGAEHFADLLEEFRIALAGRDFHAHAPRHLMGDLEIHLGHRGARACEAEVGAQLTRLAGRHWRVAKSDWLSALRERAHERLLDIDGSAAAGTFGSRVSLPMQRSAWRLAG